MSKKTPARTWTLVLSLGAPLLVVGGAAMMITFATLIDVARINGLPFPEVFPIVVDVGMVASMVTAAQLRRLGIDGQWLAYCAFFVLSLVSVVANGTHALSTADLARTTPWAASLIGAVPSATLLVITHLVMKLVPDERERAKLQALRHRAEPRTVSAVPAPAPPLEVTSAAPSPVAAASPARTVPAAPAAEALRLVPKPAAPGLEESEVRERVLEHLRVQGARPTGAVVGEWLGGKSAKTGQRFLARMDEDGCFRPASELHAVNV